jgi:uncharacterized protein
MYRISSILLLLLLSDVVVNAQSKNSITVLAKSKRDGVWLRWAPTSPAVWQLGNKQGYLVERFTILPDGNLENNAAEKLTTIPLKPYPLARLDRLSSTVKEVGALSELIYETPAKKPVKALNLYGALAKKEELENKYSVALLLCDLSRETAKAAGLFWADTTALKGKRYIYRISLADKPASINVEPGVIVIDAADEQPLMVFNDLKAEFRNKTVSLNWSTRLHEGIYSSYHIEKSTDGKTFKRISELPYVHMTEEAESETAFYLDSLEVNDQAYYYRIAGLSPFGETGPPSNVVSGSGKNDLSGYLIIREGKVHTDKKVHLVWEFPAQAEQLIAGFVVSRSGTAGGPYEEVTKTALPKDQRNYEEAVAGNNIYYLLKAVDASGKEVASSFPFLVQSEDNTPPLIPSGLSGIISKTGIVELKWQANTDTDWMGYRVFRSNSLREEFVEVTRTLLTQPSFSDTITVKVLNQKIYYRVVAVDKNYNNSEFSSVLQLAKPDVVPPASPVFTKAELEKGGIVVQWINSPSEDIAKVELSRMEKEDKVKRVIRTWMQPASANEYTDLSLKPGNTYQYQLTVYDSTGNTSTSVSPQLYYETGSRGAVGNIQASVDRETKEVKIQWKNEVPVVRCAIYRKRNEEPLVLYRTLEGNVDSFGDKNIITNSHYVYKVQVTYPKGIKSVLSEEIKVLY